MTFWKQIAVLCFITFCVYFPSFFNPFIWDDEQFIYNNIFVKNFDIVSIFTQNTVAGAGEQSHYFRPLTTLSFAIDYAIWGNNTFGFHMTNTLLHICVGVLLSIFLYLIGLYKKIIVFVITVFLLHPTQTEAVTYINSRGDSLYSFFICLSLIAFILLLKNKEKIYTIYDLRISLHNRVWFSILTISYMCSILSKELAIAGIGLHFITYLVLKNKKICKKNIIITFLSLLSIICIYGILRTTIWHFPAAYEVDASEAYYHNVLLRIYTSFKLFWLYIGIYVFPYPLHMERTTTMLSSLFNLWTLGTALLGVLILYISKVERKINNTSWVLFGYLWFNGLFITISGIVPSVGMLYEHWLYLPAIGISICIGMVVRMVVTNVPRFKTLHYPVLIMITVILSVLTIYQNYLWGSHTRFYTHTLQFSDTPRLHNNLAMAYAAENNLDKAIEQYTKAIAIGDYYPQTHFNLANAYVGQKKYTEAIVEYEKTLAMQTAFLPAYSPLISLYIEKKDFSNAERISTQLVSLNADHPNAFVLHAFVLLKQGKLDEADTYFTKATELSENKPQTLRIIQNLKSK